MSKPYQITGHWSQSITEVRGIEKPYYVVFDGEIGEKQLHKHYVSALKEARDLRQAGKPAGVLKVHSDYTQVIESLPIIQTDYSPLEFAIL